jgi:bacterioferritin (cytochrome b1)
MVTAGPGFHFDEIPGGRRSRRAFLRASGITLAGGSAVFLGGCGGGKGGKAAVTSTDAGIDPTAIRADVDILNSALDLEHTAIAAYTAGIPLLTGTARAAAKQFLAQEFAHASVLSSTVAHAGGKPNQPSPSYDLGHPRREADVLRLLLMLERVAISAYIDAIPKLTPGSLRSTVASILTTEAQHVSVLRSELGLAPVPAPFVTGST